MSKLSDGARWIAVVVFVLAIGLLLAWAASRLLSEDLTGGYVGREASWRGSETCSSCHPDHHASWHKTFHRTMTQEAGTQSVLGVFDGRTVSYQGVEARPIERDGRFFLEFNEPAQDRIATFEVLRTVGSRRYQQYLSRLPGDSNYYRLPLLWHMGDERWMHINGAFLGPDGQDYWNHYATWNANCIFCHNTGPEPGLQNYEEMMTRQSRGESVSFDRDARFESQVAELGIACESCHGPAAEHARRNRNPLRRYLLHFGDRPDPTIVNPKRLSAELQIEICGQCHGQRTGHKMADIVHWMEQGPTFRSGDRLVDHVQVIWRDTPVPAGVDQSLFELRFWADGTPRLTAYEYQGLVQSPCFQRGELSCLSCHSMHEGDVFGQLQPANRTHLACTQCHEEIGANISGHTHHRPEGSGSDCYACHMPRAVYGIMEIHRSHRIESPDAARDATAGRPHACTTCHVDRSLVWAAKESAQWWGAENGEVPEMRQDGADPASVDSVASMLAGDPLQRAVTARLVGVEESPLAAMERAFLVPHLLLAMEDGYPAVRRFAAMSLEALSADLKAAGFNTGMAEPAAQFDFLAAEVDRRHLLDELWRQWRAADRDGLPPAPSGALLTAQLMPMTEAVEELRGLARIQSKEINIGE